MPRQTALYAAAGLAACAVVGLGLGMAKSAPTTAGYSGSAADAGADGVPSARALTSGGATLDEAAVRKIAREEAQAALSKPATKHADAPIKTADAKPAAKPDDSSASPSADGNVTEGEVDAPKPVHHKKKPAAPPSDAAGPAATPPSVPVAPPVKPPPTPAPPDQY